MADPLDGKFDDVPGQMDFDDATPAEPKSIRASDVEAGIDRTIQQVDRERTKRAVESRMARIAALKKSGADTGVSSENNIDTLEERLAGKNAAITRDFRVRQAVEKRLRDRD